MVWCPVPFWLLLRRLVFRASGFRTERFFWPSRTATHSESSKILWKLIILFSTKPFTRHSGPSSMTTPLTTSQECFTMKGGSSFSVRVLKESHSITLIMQIRRFGFFLRRPAGTTRFGMIFMRREWLYVRHSYSGNSQNVSSE